MDFPGRFIAGLLVIVLIFIFPLQYIAELANERIDALVDNRTHQFCNSVRKKGYLDKRMYEEYIGFLDATGEKYDIELQDIKPVKGEDSSPVCQVPEDIKPIYYKAVASSTAANPTHTVKKANAKTTGLRTSTINGMIMEDKILNSITVQPDYQSIQRYSLPSFTIHANYDDGTSRILDYSEYSVSGFNAENIGLHSVTITYSEGEITTSATVEVEVIAQLKKCPRCDQEYDFNPDDTDPGCPYCREIIVGIEASPDYVELTQGDTLPVTVTATYLDGSKADVTEWISNFDSEKTGMQIVTIQYEGHVADITVWVNERFISCPICDTQYPISEESCPVCAEKIIGLSASPKNITVMQYEPVSLNVTAYYADGSSRATDEWTIDRTTITPGVFEATVSYKGMSDTITLTVLSINLVKCPLCETIYDPLDNLRGCPICANEITGIEAYLTSGTNMVQLGSVPAIAVILIFKDEHREFALEGYELENYNPYEPGEQTIRVLYKGFATTIIIKVVNILDGISCPNGHVYYNNSDKTDPGCPFCRNDDEASNITYFDITYTREILESIYSYGIYNFKEGNYISVIVSKKNKSLLHRLQKTFFGTSMLGRKKSYIYGGEVCQS